MYKAGKVCEEEEEEAGWNDDVRGLNVAVISSCYSLSAAAAAGSPDLHPSVGVQPPRFSLHLSVEMKLCAMCAACTALSAYL